MIFKSFRKKAGSMRTRWKITWCICVVTGFAYAFCLPERVFDKSYSTVLQTEAGQLLSASIADDGQWRFPLNDSVPEKFAQALVTFEDKRFYYHPGIDPLSMVRALRQNLTEGKIVSGASTLSMQVIRLSRKTRQRTVFEKLMEMILATRLEFSFSKKEILSLYAAHAPFGGNVVGLEAACWRYFGRGAQDLSWGEAALLAVLPNSPSLIHPGKNRITLKKKRDGLLDKLLREGQIDSLTCALSKSERIPDQPKPLPSFARHLLTRMKTEGLKGRRVTSTVQFALQQRVEEKLQDHHERLKANQIYNGAVLVLDVHTGNTLAYAGNVGRAKNDRGQDVDIITAPRSTGSILKPILFAASLQEGYILPNTMVPDIPVRINGFSPENFSRDYDGAVSASTALVRSLNVPAVFMLRDYRYEKFYTLLKNMGMTTLHQPADHYGLSLILGGAEGSLWDITGMYASMARTLNNYFQHPGNNRYVRNDFHPPVFRKVSKENVSFERVESTWLSASSIYLTFEALKELYRPLEESGWRYFNASKQIAWKTGTSFGFRDGWAIGVNKNYAVGVWIGNADGEGRAGLTGTNVAAPLMFDIFSILPGTGWFDVPMSEMRKIITCRKSGQRASLHCLQADTVLAPARGLETAACTYHRTIHLSKDKKFRLHSGCEDIAAIVHEQWFVLPPVQEYYYKAKNISYRLLPPFRNDCPSPSTIPLMELIYPESNARIFIPRDFDGKPGRSVFELAHREESTHVFWHLDGTFIGSTTHVHRMAINPPEGDHILTVVDENGHSLEERFTVVSTL